MHGNKKGHTYSSNIIELNGTEVPFNKHLDPEKLHLDYNISRPLRKSAENMLKQVVTPTSIKPQDINIHLNSVSTNPYLAHQHNSPIQLENSKLIQPDNRQIFKKHHTYKLNRDIQLFNGNSRYSPPQKSRFTPVLGVTDIKTSNTKVLQSSFTSGSPPKFSNSSIPAQLVASSSVSTIKPVNHKCIQQYSSAPELHKEKVTMQNSEYEYRKVRNLSPMNNSSLTNESQIYSTGTSPQCISECTASSTSNLCFSKKPRVIDFKPYSINDYRKIKNFQNAKLGGLGPSYVGTEEWERKMTKKKAMKEYSELVRSQGVSDVHRSELSPGALDLRSSNPVLRRFRGELFEASPN